EDEGLLDGRGVVGVEDDAAGVVDERAVADLDGRGDVGDLLDADAELHRSGEAGRGDSGRAEGNDGDPPSARILGKTRARVRPPCPRVTPPRRARTRRSRSRGPRPGAPRGAPRPGSSP